MFRKVKPIVGLDIGSSAIKVVELAMAGKSSYKLVAFGSEPIPPESIVDGTIIDGGGVAQAIRRVFETAGIKTKEVATSLSGNAVIVKKVNLPIMTEAELADSIHWEAEQYIPFDIQDVSLDYQILDNGQQADGRGTMDVLLVAAKRDRIAEYMNVIAQAGRTPVVVDIDAFALQNAYEINYDVEPDKVIVIINVGASSININVLTAGASIYTRDISTGGNAYTEALQRELSLPFLSAEQLKRGQAVDGATPEEARMVLRAVTDNVLLEIQKTFDFFRTTAAADRFDRIVLTGGSSVVEGFGETLGERFDVPVQPFEPFRKINVDVRKFATKLQGGSDVTAAVAVGLALRRPSDR